jgi:hypothetical protein
VLTFDRPRAVAAAQSILDRGGWCVLEACVDIPRQRWEPRVLIFDLVADAVADAVEAELCDDPSCDARLTGCDRRTLCPDSALGTYLCYVTASAADASEGGELLDRLAPGPDRGAQQEPRAGRRPVLEPHLGE